MAQRWGDEFDSDDEEADVIQQTPTLGGALSIPPTQRSRVDSKGIQIVTSYRANPSNPKQLMKTTTKVRVTQERVREVKAIEVRRKWTKFGAAIKDETDKVLEEIKKSDVESHRIKGEITKLKIRLGRWRK